MNRSRRWIGVCCVALLTMIVSTARAEQSWPAFLGAGADGVDGAELPTSWDPSTDTHWKAEVPGHGQSSPVVWGQSVYLTSVEGPMKETYYVVCLSLENGRVQWQREVKNSTPVTNSLYVSRAAPTPVVDSERLVTLFESGDCLAWSHSGDLLWQRKLAEDYGPIRAKFGLGASPCQTAQSVFVLIEHEGPSCLVALGKASGETQWKADRSPRQSWSSPAIVNIEGEPQIVCSSLGSVDGYDPKDGKLLWSMTDVGGNTGATPIDLGDGSFLIGASPGRQGEHAEQAKVSNGLLQVTRNGDQFNVLRKWIAQDVNPTWASPIVHQGYAYWMNRVGVISCFNGATGEAVYTQRTKQSCWATPLAVDDRLYWFGKEGLCTVIAAGPEFKVLAENRVWSENDLVEDKAPTANEDSSERQSAAGMFSGPTVYGYAVAGNRLIVRIGKQVFCIGRNS